MNKYNWGRSSLERLSTCSEGMRKVANRALAMGIMDMSLICGHRSQEAQTEAYDNGFSKVMWPDSKHNDVPSSAFDMYPYHPRFKLLTGAAEQVEQIALVLECSIEKAQRFIVSEYSRMAGVILAAAVVEGVTLCWGGDWDGDADITDQKFMDLGHFEEV